MPPAPLLPPLALPDVPAKPVGRPPPLLLSPQATPHSERARATIPVAVKPLDLVLGCDRAAHPEGHAVDSPGALVPGPATLQLLFRRSPACGLRYGFSVTLTSVTFTAAAA